MTSTEDLLEQMRVDGSREWLQGLVASRETADDLLRLVADDANVLPLVLQHIRDGIVANSQPNGRPPHPPASFTPWVSKASLLCALAERVAASDDPILQSKFWMGVTEHIGQPR